MENLSGNRWSHRCVTVESLVQWTSGTTGLWVVRSLGLRVTRSLGLWVDRFLGSLGPWVSGFMGLWVSLGRHQLFKCECYITMQIQIHKES